MRPMGADHLRQDMKRLIADADKVMRFEAKLVNDVPQDEKRRCQLGDGWDMPSRALGQPMHVHAVPQLTLTSFTKHSLWDIQRVFGTVISAKLRLGMGCMGRDHQNWQMNMEILFGTCIWFSLSDFDWESHLFGCYSRRSTITNYFDHVWPLSKQSEFKAIHHG